MKFLVFIAIVLLIILSFQNCAQPFDVKHSYRSSVITTTDPEFEPFIEEFENLSGEKVTLPVGFGKLDPKYAGVCYRSLSNGTPIQSWIIIDKEYWFKITWYQQVNLIFHELGHCVLNRDHVKSDSVSRCPTSFMYEQIMSTQCIQDHYEEYLRELFQ